MARLKGNVKTRGTASSRSRNKNLRAAKVSVAEAIAAAWASNIGTATASGKSVESLQFQRYKGRLSQKSRDSKPKTNKRQSKTASLDALTRLYRTAWENKYKDISKTAEVVLNSMFAGSYEDRQWSRTKRRMRQKGMKAHYQPPSVRKKIRYVGPGLATGYLRDLISKEFRGGGGEFVQFGNPAVEGAFSVDTEAIYNKIGDGYQFFIDLIGGQYARDGLSNEAAFFDFLPEDWNRIADQMAFLVEEGFLPEVQMLLEDLK